MQTPVQSPQPVAPLAVGPEASADSWLDTLALLVSNGVSLEMCATRLGRPRIKIERAMQLPEFQKKLQDLVKESSDDVGTRIIQGSLVDSVLRLVRFRDDPTVSPKDRIGVCKFLIESVLGRAKNGLGLIQTSLAQIASMGQGNVEAGIDAEIMRLVDNNPVLKAKFANNDRNSAATVSLPAEGRCRDSLSLSNLDSLSEVSGSVSASRSEPVEGPVVTNGRLSPLTVVTESEACLPS